MAMQKEYITVDEFERLVNQAENTDRRLELFNGEIIEKMPTLLHMAIVHLLDGFLFLFLREHPIAWAGPEARFQLPSDRLHSIVPDLCVILKQGRTLIVRGVAPYMPDIAIEVQSPDQSDKLMQDKGAYYLANGSKMVWLVYPRQQLVEVLTPTERHLLTIDDTLMGGDVLPGFSVAIREIFPQVA